MRRTLADIREEWTAILRDIQRLSELAIHRQFFQTGYSSADVTLQIVADTSTKAYGAVTFLTRGSEVTFVMAKNCMAPLKSLTLPMLELLAAVVASRVAKITIDALKLQDTTIYFRGDSQIALHWLASTKALPQFVSRRVREIKEAFPSATWSYCPTQDNPANLLTCGVSFEFLSSPDSLWWNGPAWLTTSDTWPKWELQTLPMVQLHAAAALSKEFTLQPMAAEGTGLHQAIKLTSFSSLNRLLAVTAYVYRYVNNLCKSQPKLTGPLTAAELSCAQRRWVQECQKEG